MRETVADSQCIWRMKKALYASNQFKLENCKAAGPYRGGGGGGGKHMLQNLAQVNSDKYLTIEEKAWTPKETCRST